MKKFKQPETKEEVQKWLNDKAVYYLSRRDHSRKELSVKLEQALSYIDIKETYSIPEVINTVLEQMEEYDYLNDQRFTRMYCRYKASSYYGPQRIQQALFQKGISKTDYQLAIEEESLDFFALAHEYADRKFSFEQLSDFKHSQKCFRHMASRGYSVDQIKHAFALIKESMD